MRYSWQKQVGTKRLLKVLSTTISSLLFTYFIIYLLVTSWSVSRDLPPCIPVRIKEPQISLKLQTPLDLFLHYLFFCQVLITAAQSNQAQMFNFRSDFICSLIYDNILNYFIPIAYLIGSAMVLNMLQRSWGKPMARLSKTTELVKKFKGHKRKILDLEFSCLLFHLFFFLENGKNKDNISL